MEGVSLAFSDKKVLSSFSLSVRPNERVCLRGASGCGKSTVLRCLLGLVIPAEGRILIGNDPLTPDTVWRLRSHMAWVPQEPDWGSMTVQEALDRPFSYRINRAQPVPPSRISDCLEKLDLSPGLLKQPTAELSGGEKQRLGLVSVLLLGRPILLLDEVTSALDAANRDRVRNLLAELHDTTILAVSHDADSETWAERIIDIEAFHA